MPGVVNRTTWRQTLRAGSQRMVSVTMFQSLKVPASRARSGTVGSVPFANSAALLNPSASGSAAASCAPKRISQPSSMPLVLASAAIAAGVDLPKTTTLNAGTVSDPQLPVVPVLIALPWAGPIARKSAP